MTSITEVTVAKIVFVAFSQDLTMNLDWIGDITRTKNSPKRLHNRALFLQFTLVSSLCFLFPDEAFPSLLSFSSFLASSRIPIFFVPNILDQVVKQNLAIFSVE